MVANKKQIEEMLDLIEDCIKSNNLYLLSIILCDLKNEYVEIAELATDGHYWNDWTHKQVLDYITYNSTFRM